MLRPRRPENEHSRLRRVKGADEDAEAEAPGR